MEAEVLGSFNGFDLLEDWHLHEKDLSQVYLDFTDYYKKTIASILGKDNEDDYKKTENFIQ